MVYVTHDQAEAMALAQQIAVMDKGRLVQVADPHTLYREPRTRMVAGFIGKGAVVKADVVAGPADAMCEVRVFGSTARLRCTAEQTCGAAAVCLRPEDLEIGAGGIAARVQRVTYKGGVSEIEIVPRGSADVLTLLVEDAPGTGSDVPVRIKGGWVIPER